MPLSSELTVDKAEAEARAWSLEVEKEKEKKGEKPASRAGLILQCSDANNSLLVSTRHLSLSIFSLTFTLEVQA